MDRPVSAWAPDPTDEKFSEDCLKLDIYAPSSAKADSKLPVFFYIEGGGFSYSSQPPNGTTLVKTSNHEMVVVTLTYRVGPYGFLGGSATGSKSDDPAFSLNNGLKDQRKALKWVKDHIASFGGDPSHIVIGGASAGGGSVVLQLANPSNEGYFVGVAAESAAWPAMLTASQGQFMYDNLVNRTDCKGKSDTLSCMRDLKATAFQKLAKDATVALPGGTGTPVYMYGPTLDGDFVQDYMYSHFWQANQLKLPSIFGDDSYEGVTFAPKTIDSVDAADAFVRNQFPGLNSTNLDFLHAHAHYKGLLAAKEYRSFAARLYSDLRYVCPGLFMAWASPTRAQNNDIWTYRWDVGAATHVAESESVWGGGADGTPANNIHHYWASFIKYLDPNKSKASGAPDWEASGKDDKWMGNRVLFTDHSSPNTTMEAVDGVQWDACVYLMDIGVQLSQ